MYPAQDQSGIQSESLHQSDLAEGLFVLELEERLELATVAVEAAESCRRCDVTD
ncbi:hypothetical protein GCM10027048_34850 [Hymenobacter coalescens]